MDELTLTVVAVAAAADDVKVLTLATPGEQLPAWDAGAHIDVILDNDTIRQYSLCGDPSDRQFWRIAVLKEEAGRGGSLQIHERIQVGEQIRIRGPRNHFPLVPAERYCFIAGGIGITPILPMIDAAQAIGAEWTLTYGGRSRRRMAFVDELTGHGPRVDIVPGDERGRVDLDALLGKLQDGTKVYCCGPTPLLAAVEVGCARLPAGSLHTERFAPKQPIDHEIGLGEFDVVFARSQRTATVKRGQTILGAAQDVGVEVLTSCEEGTCGTCEARVLAGQPDHRDSVLTDEEQQADEVIMICVSRSHTPVLTLDL